MSAVFETAIGEERRRHGRWEVSGAIASVAGRKFSLVDISIGGFLARVPDDGAETGAELNGMIHWKGKRELIEFPFSATVVRRLDDGKRIAAQFHSLEDEAIDTLLRFLSAIEQERHDRVAREQRAAERRILMRKLVLWGVIGGSALVALLAVWLIGFSGS